MPESILLTKIYIPPPRPKIVLRPRLVQQLNEGLAMGCTITLISASAGFGKTTLISEWIASCGRQAAWLSLDERDNDSARFISLLVAALQTIKAGTGEGLLAALQSPQPLQIITILTTLVNEISTIPEKFMLVIDDYHTIDSQSVAQSLDFMVKNMPPQMHLVISTREDPTLHLARLRSQGQLNELRTRDLRFTPSEAAGFLNTMMGLNLSKEDIAALDKRTEGWIAGLQMAAISMREQQDTSRFIQSFTGSHHFILDYLMEEVLQQQPKSIQAFLLRTSILDRLCGPLCEAILHDSPGSGQKSLEYLEHANLFIVPLDNERRWYRYHHLFGDLLRQRLGQSASLSNQLEEVSGYHLRASEWLENHGFMLEAFHHAAAANDIERAERLMESKAINLHLRNVIITILDWLDGLPASVLDARPLLRVRSATLALMAWRITGMEEKLDAAEKALQKFDLDDTTRDLIGQIACARATLAITRYDTTTMLTQASCALEYLNPDNHRFLFTANWSLATGSLLQGDRVTAAKACQQAIAFSQKSGSIFSKILAMTIRGNLQKMDNQLHQAVETYCGVLELAGDNPHPNEGNVHLNLAEIYYEWNDLETAELHGQKSLELMEQYALLIDRFIFSYVLLAKLNLVRGKTDDAAAMLARAEQSAREKNFLHRLSDIAAVKVMLLIRQDRLAAAAQLAQQYELPLSQTRVLIAQGDPAAALAILDPFRQQMEARSWADEKLKTMVLQANALYLCGQKDQAERVLGEALALAEPGGFIRLFVDTGAPLGDLLSAADEKGIQLDYIRTLLAAFEAEKEYVESSSSILAPSSLFEPLSPRELEVLKLIAQGYSNHEICEHLFLALDTVKGHNRRIFQKLQVQRRTEAIARARELGLL